MNENKDRQLTGLQEFGFQKTAVFAGIQQTREVVALKPLVENLGLSWKTEYERLVGNPELLQLSVKSYSLGADGKSREMICLPTDAVQEWLWNIKVSSRLNITLWEEYKKGLVIYLLNMLKISLDEVERLRALNTLNTQSLEIARQYMEAEEQGRELTKQAKEYFKQAKDLKQEFVKSRENPNQLQLFNPAV